MFMHLYLHPLFSIIMAPLTAHLSPSVLAPSPPFLDASRSQGAQLFLRHRQVCESDHCFREIKGHPLRVLLLQRHPLPDRDGMSGRQAEPGESLVPVIVENFLTRPPVLKILLMF